MRRRLHPRPQLPRRSPAPAKRRLAHAVVRERRHQRIEVRRREVALGRTPRPRTSPGRCPAAAPSAGRPSAAIEALVRRTGEACFGGQGLERRAHRRVARSREPSEVRRAHVGAHGVGGAVLVGAGQRLAERGRERADARREHQQQHQVRVVRRVAHQRAHPHQHRRAPRQPEHERDQPATRGGTAAGTAPRRSARNTAGVRSSSGSDCTSPNSEVLKSPSCCDSRQNTIPLNATSTTSR